MIIGIDPGKSGGVASINEEGILECLDNGYSCELGSLCFNNISGDNDDLNDLDICVDDESLIFFKTPKGISEFVDYSISLSAKDIDEELIEYKNSESETITMRVAASFPLASAGDDKVYTSIY